MTTYWVEDTIREALEDSKVTLPDHAIMNIAAWIEGNLENESLMRGPTENPMIGEMDSLKREHKSEMDYEKKNNEKFSEIQKDKIGDLRRTVFRLQEKLENDN